MDADEHKGLSPTDSGTLDIAVLRNLAQDLRARELSAQPGRPLSAAHPALTVADAYRVQLEYVKLRTSDGAKIVGHKVGCTNPLLQAQFGIDQPDYGHLLDDMVLSDGAQISIGRLIAPRIEAEIAFVLGRTLEGPKVTALDVLDATRAIIPCFEIVDSRIEDWRITIADTVADNGSSSAVVLGHRTHPAGVTDLRSLGLVLEVNGRVAGTGAGAAVLGHPAESVAWLAKAIAPLGQQLKEGHVVLSGALSSSVKVNAGDVVYADFGVLGVVRCSFDS
ncbi:MAG: 2-keto-4-pentenoate hydratase [Gemmatimonadaceae bacterium]